MSIYVPRKRLNVYLELEHVRRLRDMSMSKGISKSAIVAAALSTFLSPDSAERRELALTKRLDRLSNQFGRLERDQTVLIETVALYIRYVLSTSILAPESHQEAMRAQGKARFSKFFEQLGLHLQRGGSLVQELSRETQLTEPEAVGLPEEQEQLPQDQGAGS